MIQTIQILVVLLVVVAAVAVVAARSKIPPSILLVLTGPGAGSRGSSTCARRISPISAKKSEGNRGALLVASFGEVC